MFGAFDSTVRLAVPLTDPLVAETEAAPDALGELNKPAVVTDPTPLSFDQVNAGCVVNAAPNWSLALAENC
jgi:hypothetical protein